MALAEDKARRAASLAPSGSPRLTLGADTLVCVQSEDGSELALGKPGNLDEARMMIRLLVGRSHCVRTGIALLDRVEGRILTARSDSMVSFSQMSEADIEDYLEAGEWEGAAGAYRIQGRAAFFIDRLEGSWTGVVGLPLRELYVILLSAGYRVRSTAS
jgi:septum formation protein